jgi:hypothetical protein
VTAPKKNPQTFTLTLRSERSEVPVFVRLKMALKTLLRSYGFRCTRIGTEEE